MWRAIWNGPFYIGRLEQPVTVGDVLMKCLETLWRGLIVLVCCAVAALALLFGGIELQDRQAERERGAIATTVSSYPAACSPAYPLSIQFTNTSKRTVTGFSYSLQGFEEGRSRDLAGYGDRYLSEDHILGPGVGLQTCRRLTGDMERADRVAVEVHSVQFQD